MKKIFIVIVFSLLPMQLFAEDPNLKTTTENYEDWQVACVENAEIKQCEMKQTLSNQEGNLVAVISLAKSNKDLIFQLALPHMLDLSVKVDLLVDDTLVEALPYSFCNRAACFVVVQNENKIFDAFKSGNIGLIKAKIFNGEFLELNYSLKGFSSALKSLLKNSQ